MSEMSRRTFLAATSLSAMPAAWDSLAAGPQPADSLGPLFPTQPPELVRELVTVAHGNLKRVEELVSRRPSLARAAWDWGFGDWEDALGAASHIGSREVAEYLLAHGARPTLFSAAMLGQTDVVRSFVEAAPGIVRIKGPHGITLLAHARAGGERARAVLEYLTPMADADLRPVFEPLSEAEQSELVGTYRFGSGESERIEVAINRGQLAFRRFGATARPLFHVGQRRFFPLGADAVRIGFGSQPNASMVLTVHDPGPVLTALRESA